MTTIKSILLLLAVVLFSGLQAQKVFLDQPLTVGDGVVVFPSVDDPTVFYYMPDRPRVALNDGGQPEFSFTLFTEKDRSGIEDGNNEEQKGGGILHLLMTFGVTADRLSAARSDLANQVSGAVLKGPVIFTKGNIALISAVADPTGNFTKKIVGLGKAPIIEGSKASIAFLLEARGAKLLWSTFNNSTPDISFSMEMDIDGYLSPIKGRVEGDFDQIYTSHNASLGVTGTVAGVVTIGAEIGMTLEKLKRENKIRVYTEGDDAQMAKLLETAYNKLVNMMFVSAETAYAAAKKEERTDVALQRINSAVGNFSNLLKEPEKEKKDTTAQDSTATPAPAAAEAAAADEGGGGGGPDGADYFALPKRIPSLLGPAFAPAPAPVAPFSVLASYRYRRVKQTGTFSISFDKVSATTRVIRMDGNIGDMRQRCERCFNVVALDEMDMFKQREITVILDGSLLSQFKNFVNSVDVTLRKEHPDGYVETETVGIDYARFTTTGRIAKLVYGRQEGENEDWLDYEYRVTWNFHGDHTIQGEWTQDASDYIALAAPLGIKEVNVDADPDLMEENDIRIIQVMLEYDLGGKTQIKKVRLKSGGTLSENVPVVLPLDSEEVFYRYSVVTNSGEKFVQQERLPVILLSLDEITNIPE